MNNKIRKIFIYTIKYHVFVDINHIAGEYLCILYAFLHLTMNNIRAIIHTSKPTRPAGKKWR